MIIGDIEKLTRENNSYRRIVKTTPEMQLVLMSLKPHEDIGDETHPHTTQFIRVEGGTGKAIMNGKEHAIKDGSALIVPPGVKHNIVASGRGLKLYTLYSPPEHTRGSRSKPKNGHH